MSIKIIKRTAAAYNASYNYIEPTATSRIQPRKQFVHSKNINKFTSLSF